MPADGRADIAVVETDGISIWLASGTGFAQAPISPVSIPGATEIAAGDVDGDRALDVAVGPWNGEEVTMLVGKGATLRRVKMCG